MLRLLLFLLFGKEVETMAVIYATLIVKGKKPMRRFLKRLSLRFDRS